MNKKYMDFVPAKPKGGRGASRIVTVQTTQTEVVSLVKEEIPNPKAVNPNIMNDLNKKFVKTDVPKRPLSQRPATAGDALAALKAQNIKAKKSPKTLKRVEKSPVKAAEMSLSPEAKKNIYQTPKNPFINQGNVAKRPLSRNIYLKELEESKKSTEKKHEEPTMIASKTEKKSHWKTVLAVIITIIVGAVAGVAAFLLLPK